MSAGGWDLEEIRRRADIVEIVSPHVRLQKRGRRLVGLCPFHKERTPSFTLDPESGLWHCFGCKAGGDLFRFVEMMEKVPFAEAVELLARRLGLPPRHRADAAQQRVRERMLALHEQASELFRASLRSKAGERARAYAGQRGISAESAENFALGYAPQGWDALLKAMAKRGYPGEEMVRAGLAVSGDRGPYDRFRDRLIFPIRDASGRVIAFGGRALSDEQQPKYLNSPETRLFEKGRVLYAFDRARRAMAEAGRAIVVEGYLDVIACHEAGLAETVATMGTALTAEHVELLRRRVSRLALAFDADSAGLSAALRSRELFQQAGLEVQVASLPESADPDRVIREQGPEAFQGLIGAAVPILEWELSRILAAAAGEGGRERMRALQDAISVLARVPPGADREYYVRWLVERSGPDSPERRRPLEVELREALAREARRARGRSRRMPVGASGEGSASGQGPGKPAAGRLQAALLAAFLQHEELALQHVHQLEAEDFPTDDQRRIFEAVRGLVEREEQVSPQVVLEELEPAARPALAELALDDVPEERIEESVSSAVRRILEDRILRQESLLRERLEQAGSAEQRDALLQELTEARRKRSEIAGRRIVGDE